MQETRPPRAHPLLQEPPAVTRDPHLNEEDAVERLARRVGRTLGTLAVAALAIYLMITYL